VQYPPSRDGILCGILFQDERLVLIMIATPADSLLFFRYGVYRQYLKLM